MDDSGGSFESLSTIQPNIRRLDPFWATRIWQRLTKEALVKVKVCRQRYFLKNYDDVFNGEDLATIVLQFLKECTSELDVQRIDRSNAIKVCQVLMNKRFFESIAPKSNLKFEDSSNRLYRFIQDQTAEENSSEEGVEEKEDSKMLLLQEEKENMICSSYKHSSGSTFTPNSKFCPKRLSMRLKTPLLRVRDTKPSPVRFAKRSARDADEEGAFCSKTLLCIVHRSLRDTALALLLQLVDIPMLESIVSVSVDLPEIPEAPQPFVLENDFTPRRMQPGKVDFQGAVAEIPWVKASSACLNGKYPVGLTGLWSVQSCKILCYKSVVERFSCCAESIIPGDYFSLCIPIVQMLMREQRERAQYALQLLVYYLPTNRRRQLRNLLRFLHLVVDDIFVSVDKKVTNCEAVQRDFLGTVFKHPLVSDEPQKILFDFLLLKSEKVFDQPPNLYAFKQKGMRICQVNEKEDAESSDSYTRQCLLDLASAVVDSTDIKLYQKRNWLKRLKKHHPSAYKASNFDD